MAYPFPRNNHYLGADNKALPKSSQGKISPLPKFSGLWERITKVLKTDSTGEIARKLGISDASVSGWKKGTTHRPKDEHLRKIAEYGNVTTDELLYGFKGKEPETIDDETRIEFGDAELTFINILADKEGKEFDEVVRELVAEALRYRSGVLFADYNKLPKELLENLLEAVITPKKRRNTK